MIAQTAMAAEIAEVPAAAERLLSTSDPLRKAVDRIAEFSPLLIVLCGRGSSGHAGVYLRYLAETRLGLLASAAAPSVFTAYRARPQMRGALFVVISQSGRSPDLVTATQAARGNGALTLAIVNDAHSPVAQASELVSPIEAGPERAVAATKTVALSMMVGAQLTAALARDQALQQAVGNLPERFNAALQCDWSGLIEAFSSAPAAFTAGRGYAFGPIREIALKLTETLRIPALGFSAAELRHGPRAAVTPSTPVLVFRQNDETADATDELVRDLRQDGITVFCAGGPEGNLPWIGDGHPALDPVAMLLPAYLAIEKAALARGLDPDNPPYLSKITKTY